MWFGGQGMHPALLRRIVRYGNGLNPFGPLSDEDWPRCGTAMSAAGRDPASWSWSVASGGRSPARMTGADLDQALEALPAQLAPGYSTICFKPSMFVDDAAEVGAFCRELVRKVEAIAA